MTQPQRLAQMLLRKRGVTAMEIIRTICTVCPHKRMSDLKACGWTITKKQVSGKTYHRYFGIAPKVAA